MSKIKVLDKEFEVFISESEIQSIIANLAKKINTDFADEDVVFMGVLNGCFMFAADLYKRIELHSQITFLKLASYEGTESTGNVQTLIGLNENLENKTVIIIEDIIDTGNTFERLVEILKEHKPKELKIVTMLLKPDAYKKNIPIDYVGAEIPNDFVLGYGLDYNGYGRNLSELYKLCSD